MHTWQQWGVGFQGTQMTRCVLARTLWCVLGAILIATLAMPAGAQRVKLTIMMPGSTGGVYPEGVIEGFMEKHPEIDVEVLGGGWGDLLEKIPVQFAAGTAPDVWYGEAGRAAEWGYQGIIENLKPYIDRDLNLDDFFLLEASSDPEGRVWGIPGGFQMTNLFYLTSMFDQAGVTYPNDSWTVSDLVDAAKKLTRRSGDEVTQYGFHSPTGGTNGWILWIHLLGGSVMDESLTESRMNTPESVNAIEFMRQLMWVEEVSPKFEVESGYSLPNDNLAMEFNIYIRNHTLQESGVMNYDVAKVPAADDGRRYTTVVPNVWMINKDSAVKEAAWEFLKYYVSQEVQEKVVAKGSEVPVNRMAGLSFLNQPPPPRNIQAVLDSFAFAHTLDENAAWRSWWSPVRQALYPTFRNDESASASAARAHQTLQVILDEVYK